MPQRMAISPRIAELMPLESRTRITDTPTRAPRAKSTGMEASTTTTPARICPGPIGTPNASRSITPTAVNSSAAGMSCAVGGANNRVKRETGVRNRLSSEPSIRSLRSEEPGPQTIVVIHM